MHKKAQTATEYLIILAVVIIIALIVVGVMGGIPGIGGGAGARASQSYWSTADVAFTSYSIDSTGLVTLSTRNNLVNAVTIDSISIGGVDLTAVLLPALPVTLNSGESITLSGTAAGLACTSGSFSHAVSIGYTDTALGGSYTFDGDGQNLEGTCAT